jgi:hypothetical protein
MEKTVAEVVAGFTAAIPDKLYITREMLAAAEVKVLPIADKSVPRKIRDDLKGDIVYFPEVLVYESAGNLRYLPVDLTRLYIRWRLPRISGDSLVSEAYIDEDRNERNMRRGIAEPELLNLLAPVMLYQVEYSLSLEGVVRSNSATPFLDVWQRMTYRTANLCLCLNGKP